jgi:hypothetical protein
LWDRYTARHGTAELGLPCRFSFRKGSSSGKTEWKTILDIFVSCQESTQMAACSSSPLFCNKDPRRELDGGPARLGYRAVAGACGALLPSAVAAPRQVDPPIRPAPTAAIGIQHSSFSIHHFRLPVPRSSRHAYHQPSGPTFLLKVGDGVVLDAIGVGESPIARLLAARGKSPQETEKTGRKQRTENRTQLDLI